MKEITITSAPGLDGIPGNIVHHVRPTRKGIENPEEFKGRQIVFKTEKGQKVYLCEFDGELVLDIEGVFKSTIKL